MKAISVMAGGGIRRYKLKELTEMMFRETYLCMVKTCFYRGTGLRWWGGGGGGGVNEEKYEKKIPFTQGFRLLTASGCWQAVFQL